jgi:transcriptional regulator with XRE-family HTH domain
MSRISFRGHGRNHCDNRSNPSSPHCDNRGIIFRDIRNNRRMYREWLRNLLDGRQRGTATRLAEHMGIPSDYVSKMLSGVRDITADELRKISEFFEVEPPGFAAAGQMVPIVGRAGAGPDGAVMFATGHGNFGEVPAPIGSSPTTEALEVQGESMRGIANDGWLIFYDDKMSPQDEHMGEPCVCFLEDERVLVKIPEPGSQAGLFHLLSANAATMRDVPVRYFALVTDIKPRRAAERFIKRNPDHPVHDVKLAG